jgi:hypothetical protein
MAGIGGFVTVINGTENFNNASNAVSTSVTATSDLTDFIGEVTSISMPELSITDIDVSSFDSPGNFMVFKAGSIDPGLIDVELNYDAVVDPLLLAAVGNENEIWQISFPDDSTWKCNGYISKVGGGSSAPNDKVSRVASIKCEGVPTQSVTFTNPDAPNTNP